MFGSPFERDVYDELTRHGLRVHSQIGCGGYRIDFGIVDPDFPGRFLLAVECDGATYHSAHNARERDRLRQSVLEGLGWRFCRIWSTDWVHDRESQVQRVLAAFERARRLRRAEESKPSAQTSATPNLVVVTTPPVAAPPKDDPEPPTANYVSIDQVPANQIRQQVTQLLGDWGVTGKEDLVKSVSRSLGFARTGGQIKTRIETEIDEMIKAMQITIGDDGRIGLATTTKS